MINVAVKSKGTIDRSSILSINVPDPQSVKNQGNIQTLMRHPQNQPQYSQPDTSHAQPQYSRPDAPQNQPQYSRPDAPQNQPWYSRPDTSHAQPQYSRPDTSHAQPQYSQPAMTCVSQPQTVQPAFTSAMQNTGSIASSSVIKPIPTLQNKVQKGQKTLLCATPLDAVNACFGWNTTDSRCDVDVSAFLLGADGRVIGDSWFVFYGQTLSPDQSTRFTADSPTDRETIQINFKKLDSSVKKIVFVLTINDALANRLHFGMLKDAYVRIMDSAGNELVSFMMTEYYSNVISMMIGELYQHNGAWKFNAVGNGVAKDLAGLCELYGVQVID